MNTTNINIFEYLIRIRCYEIPSLGNKYNPYLHRYAFLAFTLSFINRSVKERIIEFFLRCYKSRNQ